MKFGSVLIANRGEIAVRLVRACAALGLESVAVYSDADGAAPHVAMADRAFRIGPAEARLSYLDGAGIIAVARRAGVGAIHPGYGFLAENAAFAHRCHEAGLVFIGPAPAIIAAMGAKHEAKRIASVAGVACVPGYHGEDQDDLTLLREAERIGTPLLIKASAGGGGRGMRRIDDLGQLADQLARAREEARRAFGDATLLLERCIEAPRHIEVQILADRHGRVLHLFERDCSVQRNYQKLIEEAPAPNLDAALRARILAQAVQLAGAVHYDNVGTVEFVLDAARGEAYFLEMNTRLQVEHPVTEAITGLDLAAWQIRVAGGERLPFTQEDITCTGWAVEARVAAEDAAAGYRPHLGTIVGCAEPRAPGVRVDSGIAAGTIVTPYYDSMLAKVIAHGADRAAAIRRLRRALASFHIDGVDVNTAFLRDVIDQPAFRAGRHLTDLIAATWPNGWQACPFTDAVLAHAVLASHLHAEQAAPGAAPWSALGAWRLGEPSGRRGAAVHHVRAGGTDYGEFRVSGRAGSYTVERDGNHICEVSDAALGGGLLRLVENGERHVLPARVDGREVSVHDGAGLRRIEVLRAEQALLARPPATGAQGNVVIATTPGLVAEVLVAPGERVEAGQPVVVLEAMKLLQQLTAPRAGTVDTIHHRPGDPVEGGAPLLSIVAAADPEA